jgi:hypothetical protein
MSLVFSAVIVVLILISGGKRTGNFSGYSRRMMSPLTLQIGIIACSIASLPLISMVPPPFCFHSPCHHLASFLAPFFIFYFFFFKFALLLGAARKHIYSPLSGKGNTGVCSISLKNLLFLQSHKGTALAMREDLKMQGHHQYFIFLSHVITTRRKRPGNIV